jgi:hypothetical protein
MIRFFSTERGAHAIRRFLEVDGHRQKVRIEASTYRDSASTGMSQPATHIFSDLERVPPPILGEIAKSWDTLEAAGGHRLLNHPVHTLRRYELLRTLYEAGMNQFNIYRLDEVRRPSRYPVFIRRENEHDGAVSRMLMNPEEYDRELEAIHRLPVARDNLLAVEFCDTRDAQGIVRKYGAAIVGGEIKPFHLYVAHKPIVKHSTDAIVNAETAAEELRYFEKNPHEQALREVFALARIDYGRIDYGFRKGRLQVWEINTNPYWVVDSEPDPLRVEFLERRSQWLAQAFARIDTP